MIEIGSWDSVQCQLDDLAKTSATIESVLDDLYSYHRQIGFISDTTVRSVRHLHRIDLEHPGQYFYLQQNPERINRGVSLKPHPNPIHTIDYRDGIPCFCCRDNIQYQWPDERGYQINVCDKQLIVLPNPSPIFDHHFTIVSAEHRPQVIDLELIIEMSKKVPGYWVIENDALVGATNPWHFHLQAFRQSDLPILSYPLIETIEKQVPGGPIIFEFPDTPAPVAILKFDSSNPHAASSALSLVKSYLDRHADHRMNVICSTTPAGSTTLILGFRDTRYRCARYKVGQPGYAETIGFISVVRPEQWEEWTQFGSTLYPSIMSQVAPPNEIVNEVIFRWVESN